MIPRVIPEFHFFTIRDLSKAMVLYNISASHRFHPYGGSAQCLIESNQLMDGPIVRIFNVPQLGPRLI